MIGLEVSRPRSVQWGYQDSDLREQPWIVVLHSFYSRENVLARIVGIYF